MQISNSGIKIIAFYLPQYHPIPENDKWWGKGFTEWTNLKKAKSLFKGHCQPKEPLNDNYYYLDNIETLQWQADLAKQYGIYGFCFYHYWFDGKLLLEKPAELLLANEQIGLNYCFSWANEPWSRTWDGKNHEVLMPQNYGNESDWERHFNYLLPFFQDRRYIKVNNQPMFLIYKSTAIKECDKMMDVWNYMAVKEGFTGIHFVETLRNRQSDNRNLPFAAKVEFEPMRTLHSQSYFIVNKNRIRRYIIKIFNGIFSTSILLNPKRNYSKIYNIALKKKSPAGTYGGVFTGWDNTPRRGNAATIITEAVKEEFKKYLKEKINITLNHYHTNYVFINAWNEWCEGAYLEPDKKHKYEYLEAISETLTDY